MHHLDTEIDRKQFSMIALEELVHQDSFARLVDLFVDALCQVSDIFQRIKSESDY